jgi:hypothetical protein
VKPKIDLRAEQELIERIDALALRLSQPGALVSRSAAARIALVRGLDALDAERKEKPKLATKSAKK